MDIHSPPIDPLLQVPREHPSIFSLQILVPPIFPGDHAAARCRPAPASQGVVVVIGGGPIVRQLLANLNLPQRDKHNLPLHPDIRIAGMIAENHAAFALLGVARPDKKIIGDLNFRRPQDWCDLAQRRAREDVSAFHADDLARLEFANGK